MSVLLGNRNAATHFGLTASARTTAGIAVPLTVRALTPTNQVDWLYGGTVHFSSSDAQATLPADTPFVLTDGGARGFAAIVLRTAGEQTITATDTVTGSVMGSFVVTVTAAAADHLSFTVPDHLTAGVPFDILVTVQDAFNNTATGYLGTLDSMLSPGMDLGSYTFTAADQGQATLAGLVLDAGDYTLTGSDVANAALSGSVTFTVNPSGAPPPGEAARAPPHGQPRPSPQARRTTSGRHSLPARICWGQGAGARKSAAGKRIASLGTSGPNQSDPEASAKTKTLFADASGSDLDRL